MKNKKLTPEQISYDYELNNAFKFKSKRQVFIDGYNKALNDKFLKKSKIIIYTLFSIGLLTIIYSLIQIFKLKP